MVGWYNTLELRGIGGEILENMDGGDGLEEEDFMRWIGGVGFEEVDWRREI